MTPDKLDPIIMAYAKAADGIGCERGSHLYDEIARGLTAAIPLIVTAEIERLRRLLDDVAQSTFDGPMRAKINAALKSTT